MGILDFSEEAAGAFAADKGLEAIDPNAGILAKGAAAIAGFEGVKMVKEHMAEGAAQTDETQTDEAQPDGDAQTDGNT